MLLFAVSLLSAGSSASTEAADDSVRQLQLELEQLRRQNSRLREDNQRLSSDQHSPPPVALEQLKGSKPNLLIVFGDDVGYADLNCFGHPTARTPNLDKMAAEGAKLVQYLSAANICSPSRGSLMTGRLYGRLGIWPGTFSPSAVGGLQNNETTLATALRGVGYTCGMVGKVRCTASQPRLQALSANSVPTDNDSPCAVCARCATNSGIWAKESTCPATTALTTISESQ